VRSNNGLGNRIEVRLTRLHMAVSHFVPRSSGYALTTSRRKDGIMDLERMRCCYSFNSGISAAVEVHRDLLGSNTKDFLKIQLLH